MIKTIKSFILHTQKWNGDDEFIISNVEMPSIGYTTVGSREFEVEIPDNYDPRPQQIKMLQERRADIAKEFSERCLEIDRQINKLSALEYAT